MAATKLPLPKEHTGTRQGEALQQTTARTATTLNGCPFVVGNRVSGLVISTARVNVEHKLGRTPVGFFVIWATSPSAPYVDLTGVTNDKTIALKADAIASCDLWFF